MGIFIALGIGFFILLLLGEFFLLLHRKRQFGERQRAFVLSEWHTIVRKVDSDPHHAILEADKLLDYVLKKKGYGGSLGEKLQKAASNFTHINNVWEAHKLRNRIVHEMGIEVSGGDAHRALSYYRQALNDLDMKI